MPQGEDAALGHLLALLHEETFTRKPENDNKPINRPSSRQDQLVIGDSVKSRLYTDANVTYVWGMSGFSDEAVSATVANHSVRWSFTGVWG